MTAPTVGAPVSGGMESSPVEGAIERLSQKPMASLGEVMAGNAQAPGEVVVGGQTEPNPVESAVADLTAATEQPEATETPVEGAPEPQVETPAATLEIVATDEDGETVLRARDPKTGQFAEMDQTRTYELAIKDKTTGETKLYQKTLPDLMRLAKDGIATQKYQTEVRQAHDELSYYRQNVPAWQKSHETIQQKAEGYKALAMELLTADENTVISRREAYAAQNTPDRVVARERAALDAERQRLASERQSWQFRQQVDTVMNRIQPAIQQAESLVGPDAAAGKLTRGTAHLYVNGRIPPEHFPQLEAFVQGPYLQWAQQEAARINGSTAEAAKLAEAARKAQATAQKVVNQTGRQVAPAGTNNGAAPRTAPKDVNDAIERISLGRNRMTA